MDCSTLETLIENHEPIDLIDIRAKEEFVASHIPGARSVPFAELCSPKIFRRGYPMTERIYVISDDRGGASLAAGILRSGGWSDPVVVDGGMKAGIAQGFPVRRPVFLKVPVFLYAGAILSGIAAALALRNVTNFSWRELVIAGLLLLVSAALVLKGNLFALMDNRTRGKLNPTPTIFCPRTMALGS